MTFPNFAKEPGCPFLPSMSLVCKENHEVQTLTKRQEHLYLLHFFYLGWAEDVTNQECAEGICPEQESPVSLARCSEQR